MFGNCSVALSPAWCRTVAAEVARKKGGVVPQSQHWVCKDHLKSVFYSSFYSKRHNHVRTTDTAACSQLTSVIPLQGWSSILFPLEAFVFCVESWGSCHTGELWLTERCNSAALSQRTCEWDTISYEGLSPQAPYKFIIKHWIVQ